MIFEKVSVRKQTEVKAAILRRIHFVSSYFKFPVWVSLRQQCSPDLDLVGRCGSRLLFQGMIQSNVPSDTHS